MGPFRNAAAHNLSDLAIAIALAPQIAFLCLVPSVQYRLPTQVRHMSVSQLTKLPLDHWRHRSSLTGPGAPTVLDERLGGRGRWQKPQPKAPAS
jgi:hypothetical protein